jgi:hypothetical protein
MTTRRKRPAGEKLDATRAFSIVVEEMRGHFRAFGEQLGALSGDVAVMKGDIAVMKGDIVEMKGDIAVMKGDIVEMKGDIALLKIAVLDINRELKKKVDRDEVEGIVEHVLAPAAGR